MVCTSSSGGMARYTSPTGPVQFSSPVIMARFSHMGVRQWCRYTSRGAFYECRRYVAARPAPLPSDLSTRPDGTTGTTGDKPGPDGDRSRTAAKLRSHSYAISEQTPGICQKSSVSPSKVTLDGFGTTQW